MNRLIAIFAGIEVALGVVIGAMGHALLAPPPATIMVADTLRTSGGPDTVIIEKTAVRRVQTKKTDTLWLRDTLRILPDSVCVATIDTTMADGALIGVRSEAVLIVPPVRSTVTYTPAKRVERTIHVPVIEYRTDWRWVTIGALAGIATGMIVERVAGQ
jgi:hypothetical protein